MHACDNLCGLFGGTFDPIHYGHLAPVREVCVAAGLAKVAYIPAAAPPHRPPPQAGADHRLAMTRIALADERQNGRPFEADDVELKRRGPSYSIDTLQSLRRRHPKQRYALIVGLDALLGLETWHRWRALQQSVHIIVMTRPGWRAPEPPPAWWRLARAGTDSDSGDALQRAAAGKLVFIDTAPVDASATEVRERIARGGDWDALVPPGVGDYIRKHNLYGAQ